ncbi:S1 RNA-binding domain-containing protein [Candidatus Woesearchaeota archaeon]|nr:S1 RNA-binding domain-containing protein [Candidatus Woesearchaeota archaeon]
MFYQRHGMPEENEVVLCKVTKIYPNSVFVDLLEYNRQGMIHISEVSPGRIRNLRDFVSEGRQIVCKVLRIDHEKGHIDLSLRRVNTTQQREKLDEIKQELKAENLIKAVAQKLKQPAEKIYREIAPKILMEYPYLFVCFREVVDKQADLLKLGLPKQLADELVLAIADKFKPPKVILKGEIILHTYADNGVERVKTTLLNIEKVSPTVRLAYLGAGRYQVTIEDIDYKPAEKNLEKVQHILEDFQDKLSTAEFQREKTA